MPISRPTDIDHQPAETFSVESTIAPVIDAFADAANSLPRTTGSFLKHDGTRGGWQCDGAPIQPDDRWVALNVRYGFKYLAAGKPSEDYPQAPATRFKTRSEIPHHTDKDQWPIIDGERQDPVKEYIALDFIRLYDGSPCSYDALNKTGRRAVAELVRRIAWQRGPRGPMAKAVLKLGSRIWQSGTRTNFVPVLEIVGWVIPDGQGGMRLEEAARPALHEQLDDRVP